jgi:hypothetical protein
MNPAVCIARGSRGPGGIRNPAVIPLSAISQVMVAQH